MTSMVAFDSKVGGSNTLGSLHMSLEFSLQYNSTLGIFVSFEWWTMDDELTSKTPIFYAIVKKETTLWGFFDLQWQWKLYGFHWLGSTTIIHWPLGNRNERETKKKKKESQKKKSPHSACLLSELKENTFKGCWNSRFLYHAFIEKPNSVANIIRLTIILLLRIHKCPWTQESGIHKCPWTQEAWIVIQHEYNNRVKIGIIIPFAFKERSLFWTPFESR